MPVVPHADQVQLQKLLLGQLPSAEVERLAAEYAADDRLAILAESLINSDDDLLGLLRQHVTAVIDSDGERLVERLLERLKPILPPDTANIERADAATEPSSPNVQVTPDSLPERLEYYRPIKVLGQGGMGTVYLAEDTRLDREVAIKTLRRELAVNPQAKERFLREARTAAKLEHDHIIPIYSVGEADGIPFLAMPLLKGEPLDALIRRTPGPLPRDFVVRLAREVALGLAAAHERGLIHRDIKPGNIWIEAPTGRVKILDFGLAKAADAGSEADTETNLTASGAIVGTPAYMAPEQASGHVVDGRADLFSLGCVLYELLAGRRAFSGPNTMSILMSLANHNPAAPDTLSPDCPAGLSRLVMHLLEKDPAKRPASAAVVIQALNAMEATPVDLKSATIERSVSPATQMASLHGSSPPGHPTAVLPAAGGGDEFRGPAAVRQRTPAGFRIAIAVSAAILTGLAAVVYLIKSDQGTLVVDISDPGVQAILEEDALVVRDKDSNVAWKITPTVAKTVEKSLKPGDYKVADRPTLQLRVIDANGGETIADSFTLNRKGKTRIRVTLQAPAAADPDRRGAEWAVSLGGGVSIESDGQFFGFSRIDELPRTPFELTGLHFTNIQGVTDSGLASVKGCRKLTYIKLHNAHEVTDVGLSNFQDSPDLETLDLTRVAVSDQGLGHFKDRKKLKRLILALCARVGDAGLSHFNGCRLEELNLSGTKVTDAGMVNFSKCTAITSSLILSDTVIGDAGMAHLPPCDPLIVALVNTRVTDNGLTCFQHSRNVEMLFLSGASQVSDAALRHFQRCQKLHTIHLDRTSVTDATLAQCASFSNLVDLQLTKTQVTEAGVKKLSAALPKCRIVWDGGTIEPVQFSADRKAAEYVLSIGGSVSIDGQAMIAATAELPTAAFKLTGIHVDGDAAKKASDTGFACFQDCANLTSLFLNSSEITDAGLAHLKRCTNLQHLKLFWTPVTDAGLAHFKDCKLASLALFETRITDDGLAQFKDLSELTKLTIFSRVMTDRGMACFRESTRLKSLELSGMVQLTDEAMVHFQNCQDLTSLALDAVPVTDAGLASFKDCQHLTHLNLGRRRVGEKDMAQFKRNQGLKILHLSYSNLNDEVLGQLVSFPSLTSLGIVDSKVTEPGVKKLATALPGCRIEWDGGVIEPRSVNSDRRAAE